jgi:hypothetical protein
MLTSAHGAHPAGVLRLTSKGQQGGLVREWMGAPGLCQEYNADMGGVDAMDQMSLQHGVSWERRGRRHSWLLVAKDGILDRTRSYSFICFRDRARKLATTAALEQQKFYERLMVQWYNCAYYQDHPKALREKGLHVELYDMHNPRDMPLFESSRRRIRPAKGIAPVSPPGAQKQPGDAATSHLRYKSRLQKGTDGYHMRRHCLYCKMQDSDRRGKPRTEAEQKRTGETRRLVPKSSFGCKVCNVVLCDKGNCWKLYHKHHMGTPSPKLERGDWI